MRREDAESACCVVVDIEMTAVAVVAVADGGDRFAVHSG